MTYTGVEFIYYKTALLMIETGAAILLTNGKLEVYV